MTTFPPTPEQSSILSAVNTSRRNIMIRAYAGCGKTSTLKLIDSAYDSDPKLLMCFNKAIAEEAKKQMKPSTQVLTFNSLGHRVWSQACGRKLNLDPKKINGLFKLIAEDESKADSRELWERYEVITSAVNYARAIGYIPPAHAKAPKSLCDWNYLSSQLDETPTPTDRAYIDKILLLSIKFAYDGTIDFNDQVYMPALFGGAYPEFPVVMIDEYQDLSPVNQKMVEKLCRRSRQIGVGDEAQAIYAFRGADEHSMPTAIRNFDMDVLPLSLTFRCPSAIVENVRWRVPDFQAFKSGGTIEQPRYMLPTEIEDNSAVICRNNAPLVSCAMQLIKSGRKVDISGNDIAQKLIRSMERLGSDTLTRAQAEHAIGTWRQEKIAAGSKTANDLADCMLVFCSHGTTLATAIAYAKHLFAQSTGTTRFMTGHKSKGLEFDHVYHLNRHLMNRQGQDANVEYVIDTRPKQTLSYISTEMFSVEVP